MADYPFDRGLIIRANGDPVEAGFVATFHETPDGPAVPTKAIDLSTGHTITTNSHGIFEPFHAPAPSGYLKCAGIIQPVRSTAGDGGAATAQAIAEQALAATQSWSAGRGQWFRDMLAAHLNVGPGLTLGTSDAGVITLAAQSGVVGPATVTVTKPVVTVTGSQVDVTARITTTTAKQFDGLNISIARNQAGYPWVASIAVADGQFVNGAKDLVGQTFLSPGDYVAYISRSEDGKATWIHPGTTDAALRAEFTVTATSGGSGGSGLAPSSIGVYQLVYPTSPGDIRNFPANANNIRIAFALDKSGQLRLAGDSPQGRTVLLAELARLRARGCKVIVSIGGMHNVVDFSNTSWVTSGLQYIWNDIGGFDGIDFDMEANMPTAAQHVAVAQAAKAAFGSNLIVTCVPGGGNIEPYYAVAKALNDAGCLDEIGQQFYESKTQITYSSGVRTRIQQAINLGIPASKISVGMMIGTNLTFYWTLAQCQSYMQAAKNEFGVTKCYIWEQSRSQTTEWANAMKAIVG